FEQDEQPHASCTSPADGKQEKGRDAQPEDTQGIDPEGQQDDRFIGQSRTDITQAYTHRLQGCQDWQEAAVDKQIKQYHQQYRIVSQPQWLQLCTQQDPQQRSTVHSSDQRH